MASKPIATDDDRSGRRDGVPRPRPALHYALWTIQVLLALLFLFAGGMKLVLPVEAMAQQAQAQGQMPLPGLFLRFIGVVEVLGGLGLLLPGLLRIRTGLTPLAAAGLVIVMAGATVLTLLSGNPAPALIPLAVGLLAAFVAYGRWRLAPHRGRTGAGPAGAGLPPVRTA
jgi:uncharacterized membrane protein YphA (DoxX/SURF4 family)